MTDLIINDTVISGFTILPQEDLDRRQEKSEVLT